MVSILRHVIYVYVSEIIRNEKNRFLLSYVHPFLCNGAPFGFYNLYSPLPPLSLTLSLLLARSPSLPPLDYSHTITVNQKKSENLLNTRDLYMLLNARVRSLFSTNLFEKTPYFLRVFRLGLCCTRFFFFSSGGLPQSWYDSYRSETLHASE